MDNLLDVLGHLANVEGIHTITPGVLGRSRAHMEHFQLRVTTPISKGMMTPCATIQRSRGKDMTHIVQGIN